MLPPTPEVRAAMNRDANILVRGDQARRGRGERVLRLQRRRQWRQLQPQPSQYGVLGVWAAAQMGLDVPREYWSLVEKAWLEHQDAVRRVELHLAAASDYPVTPGMTAVGVATLFITQDYLHAADGVNCAGNLRNEAIDRGMKWLSNNFHQVATDEQYDRDLPYSTLYAVERIGVASGYKYFNGIDWYQKGADWLVNEAEDGRLVPGRVRRHQALHDRAGACCSSSAGRRRC